MKLSLAFHGGVGTVTGSKYLLTAGNTRVLVDCGMFQGLKELRLLNWQPTPFRPTTPDAVVLTVEDDGRGFNPRQRDAHAGHHFGLLTMRERAEGLGGQLTVASVPGRGTRVQAEVPLPEEKEMPFDAATARAAR